MKVMGLRCWRVVEVHNDLSIETFLSETLAQWGR